MRARPARSLPLALLALAACGADVGAVDPASAGEVRGAPLRAPKGAPADGPADVDAPAAPADDDDLGLDYADVLPPEEAARYEWVDFLTLTEFDLPEFGLDAAPQQGSREGAPEHVTELDGRLVAIEGFMNPTAFDRDGVSEFTLVADPTFCCFGLTPALNHFIQVSLAEGERTEFFSIVPIAVFGRLEVGIDQEDGIALSFYRLRADHVFCVY